MDELFEQFKRGETPNFLELMAAISEISDMWPTDVCLDCQPDNCLKPLPAQADTDFEWSNACCGASHDS